jgi:hypothetical protein
MKPFSTMIRYASLGFAVLMMTSCATKDCVPPRHGVTNQTDGCHNVLRGRGTYRS